MSTHAELRRELRPQGMIAPGCYDCPFFTDCGGAESARSLFTCFDNTCCGDGKCDNVCPGKADFPQRLKEVGGLRFDNLPLISQRRLHVPLYVPVIHHRYNRTRPLDWPMVALETYQVLRLVGGTYRAIANSPAELRAAFALDPATRIILRGTAKDAPLEQYWSYRRRDHAAAQLAKLDIAFAIGPNFSHFLDVPRTDNLFNRKRQLICLSELHDAGLNAVPHLSAASAGDWAFWARYLGENRQVKKVALEFQTGNKNRIEGLKVIDHLTRLQTETGRQLHPIIVGGGQFVEKISEQFTSFTLIDSEPFMKAVHRQVFHRSGGRRRWAADWTLPGFGIERHVAKNIKSYAAWIRERCRYCSRMRKAV